MFKRNLTRGERIAHHVQLFIYGTGVGLVFGLIETVKVAGS